LIHILFLKKSFY